MPRRTQEEAEQTRRDLLDAALTIFSRDGFEAARLEDIAQAANVTRGAIYHHFNNKEGLFSALMEDASAAGNTAIQKAVQEGGSVADVTRRILVYTLSLLEEDRHFREIMALSLSGKLPAEMKSLEKKRYEDAKMMVEGISQSFQMGIEMGEFRPDLDPVTAARAFLAFQNGLALLWLSNKEAFSIKENASALADLFLYGVMAP